MPASKIEQLLDSHQINYEIKPIRGVSHHVSEGVSVLKPQITASAQVLKNQSGKKFLLAIVSSDTFLDLVKVRGVVNHDVQLVVSDELLEFLSSKGVTGDITPAIPLLMDVPTLVDKRLLKQQSLCLDVGLGEQYLEVQQDQFRQMLTKAKSCDIASMLERLEAPTEPEKDEEEIYHSVSTFTERRIKQRLEDTLEFPPLPVIASKIIQLRMDPEADISDLTDIVELDAGLSAQVVSWAASPYYSAPGSIKSIHDAIVRVLGFDMVLNLTLGLALGKTLKMPKTGPHSCLPYWKQSVYVAAAAEALVTCIPRAQRPSFGTSYLAGLLNNFGYLIIAEVFDQHFNDICEHIDANPQASVRAAERHIIGVDRNQMASWLMEFWHMPDAVVLALRHQTNPHYDGAEWQYAIVLYLANKLLQERGMRTGFATDPIPESVFERLDITRESAEEAIDNLLSSSDELESIASEMASK